MTESTGVKGEHTVIVVFFCYFGTIKQQGVRSLRGILTLDPGPALDPLGGLQRPQAPAGSGNDLRSLRTLPSAPWELPSFAKGVTSETQGVTHYLNKFKGSYCYHLTPVMGPYEMGSTGTTSVGHTNF